MIIRNEFLYKAKDLGLNFTWEIFDTFGLKIIEKLVESQNKTKNNLT